MRERGEGDYGNNWNHITNPQVTNSNERQTTLTLQEALQLSMFSGPTAALLHQAGGVKPRNGNNRVDSGSYQEVLRSLMTQGPGTTPNVAIGTPTNRVPQRNPYVPMNVCGTTRILDGSNVVAALPQIFSSMTGYQNNHDTPPAQMPVPQTSQERLAPPNSVFQPSLFNTLTAPCTFPSFQGQANQVPGVDRNDTFFVPSQTNLNFSHMPALQDPTQQHNVLIGNMSQVPQIVHIQANGNQISIPNQCGTALVNNSVQGFHIHGMNSSSYVVSPNTEQPVAFIQPQDAVSPICGALASNISTGQQQNRDISIMQQQVQSCGNPTQAAHGCSANMAAIHQMQIQPGARVIRQVGQVGDFASPAHVIAGNQLMAIAQGNIAPNGQTMPMNCNQGAFIAAEKQHVPSLLGNHEQQIGSMPVQHWTQASQPVTTLQVPSVSHDPDINQTSDANNRIVSNFKVQPISETNEPIPTTTNACQNKPHSSPSPNLHVVHYKHSDAKKPRDPLSISRNHLHLRQSSHGRSSRNDQSTNSSAEGPSEISREMQELLDALCHTQDSHTVLQEDDISEFLEEIRASGPPSVSPAEMVSSLQVPSNETLQESPSLSLGRVDNSVGAAKLTATRQGPGALRMVLQSDQTRARSRDSQRLEVSRPFELGKLPASGLLPFGLDNLNTKRISRAKLMLLNGENNISGFCPNSRGDDSRAPLSTARASVHESLDKYLNTGNESVAWNSSDPQNVNQKMSNKLQPNSQDNNEINNGSLESKSVRNGNRSHYSRSSPANQRVTSNEIRPSCLDSAGSNVLLAEREIGNINGSQNVLASQEDEVESNYSSLHSLSERTLAIPHDDATQQKTLGVPRKIFETEAEIPIEAWEAYFDYDWTKMTTAERRKRRAYIVGRKRLPVSERRKMKTIRNVEQPIWFRALSDSEIIEISQRYPRMDPEKKGKKWRNRMLAQRVRANKKRTTENLEKENEKLRSRCSFLQANSVELMATKAENARLKACLENLLNSNPSLQSSQELSENGDAAEGNEQETDETKNDQLHETD